MTLEGYLNEITDETKPLKHSGLLRLSSLSAEELSELNEAWDAITESRRRDMIGRLVELSEDNTELDFSAFYRSRLADPDPTIRSNAARGLWECADRVVIRPLLELLSGDPEASVRCAAAGTLSNFSAMSADGKLLDRDADKVREALLTSIRSDADPEVKRRATEAVAPFNTPEIEQIIRDAYYDGDTESRRSAIYAMGNTSDSRWLPTLVEELDDDNPVLRYEAATACAQVGDESTVPHLVRLIEDDDLQVALAALRSLGAIGGALAKRAVVLCLNSGDDALETAAETALQQIQIEEDPLALRFQD